MKFVINNPAFLQSASNVGKEVQLFYITSNADGNDVMFVNTKLGAFADNVQYSTDEAQTWEQLTSETVITLDRGQTVYFRNYTWQVYNLEASKKVVETSDLYSIGGDITSLFYPRVKQLPVSALEEAFRNDENLQDASALVLKATALAEYCYNNMFSRCTNLTAAPALPATDLAEYCYNNMFNGCTSLSAAPALPATDLAEYCYSNMFYGCTSLAAAPALPATDLAEYCYSSMFSGCTSLAAAPALPATDLAKSCYNGMFYGCTSLAATPALPATDLAESCYSNMFRGCTSLTAAPALPATDLAEYCYSNMFSGCTSLAAITCLATSGIGNATDEWLIDVASTGTFTKTAGVEWPSGDSGVPDGWTVVEA